MGPSTPNLSQPDLEPPLGSEDAAIPCTGTPERPSFARGLGHLVSWAGGHAMRPQAAMGAVLLLMLGSSLLFLRARPEKSAASSRLNVIERGVPDRRDEPLQAPAPHALATAELRLVNERHRDPEERVERAAVARRASPKQPVAAEPTENEGTAKDAAVGAEPLMEASPPTKADPYAAAMALYESGNYAEAARELDIIAGSGTAQAPLAALHAARSVEAGSGCEAAASRYEAVAKRFTNASIRGDALSGAASCQKALGHRQRARELYLELREIAGFRDRADQEIAKLDATVTPRGTPPSASP